MTNSPLISASDTSAASRLGSQRQKARYLFQEVEKARSQGDERALLHRWSPRRDERTRRPQLLSRLQHPARRSRRPRPARVGDACAHGFLRAFGRVSSVPRTPENSWGLATSVSDYPSVTASVNGLEAGHTEQVLKRPDAAGRGTQDPCLVTAETRRYYSAVLGSPQHWKSFDNIDGSIWPPR